MFTPVNSELLARLEAIVGPANVLTDRDAIEKYSHDETPGVVGWPEVVVKPANRDEIVAIMHLASANTVAVTPRGAGQGLSGGAVPRFGGIVLSIERMNRILEIDHRNLMVTTEPGVITGELHRAVEAEGLFYPPDPASLDSCFIGGNIAEGAGGPRAVKYGTTKDYVAGLEVVLPDGRVLELGGKLVKDVAGYNLLQLMVGSEGTLGIVTKIILRLLPLPPARLDMLAPFDDFQRAADTVSAIIAQNIIPTTLEFMERETLLACERLLDKEAPFHDAEAHLLIQLTGQRQEDLEAELDVVGQLCLDHGARDVLVAADRPTRDRLWEMRRAIIEAMKHESPTNRTEDVSVPRSEIPALLRGVHEISARLGVTALSFGHAGDGNVHVNMLKYDMPDDEWEHKLHAFEDELYHLALRLGGTITGEHGVGATRKGYLAEAKGEAAVELMRGIKQTFDPLGILNPGKVLV